MGINRYVLLTLRIFFFISLGLNSSLTAFKTLKEAQDYATLLDHGKRGSFDQHFFKKTLTSLVERRENFGFHGRFVMRMTPYPETKFIVWGPLKGAFSSFVRALSYLESRNVLSKDFKILLPDTYFVFVGDLIGDSDSSLPTFALALSIMSANRNRIIYLKGDLENKLHWQNNGLKKQLSEMLTKVSAEKIPLERLVARFFDTLPLAFYIAGQDQKEGLIRISYFSWEFKEIDEQQLGPLFSSQALNVPELYSLSTNKKSNVEVRALIRGEDRLISYKQNPGLILITPEKGAIAWSTFSAPSKKYQKEYQFFYDAFSVLTTGQNISNAVISLYNRDVRTLSPIAYVRSYNLLTGQVVTQPDLLVEGNLPEKKARSLEDLQKDLKDINDQIDNLFTQTSQLKLMITTQPQKETT